MSYFPETIQASLNGATIRASLLVFFDFKTAPMRVWQGFGDLSAGGFTWKGIGDLGSVSGLESALGGTAPTTTFTLSGVKPETIATGLAAKDEVKGRRVTVFIQFFDADWQTYDSPYALYSGLMDQMRIIRRASERVVEVTAESLFARRAMPPWGYLTDRDQNKRHPGDRGLEQVPAMANKSVYWPLQ